MVADMRFTEHADLARQAGRLSAQVEQILLAYPACAEVLTTRRKGSHYTTPLIPEALEVLQHLDPAAWRKATALWREADRYRWELVQHAEPALLRRLKHLNHHNMTFEDWKQEALLGAYNGALRWDPARGGGWVRFACDWAYARAQRTLIHRAPSLRVPQHTWDLARDLRSLSRAAGRRVSDLEAAQTLGRQLDIVRAARRGAEVVSTEQSDYGAEGTTFGELLTDEGPTPDEDVAERIEGRRIRAAVLAACMDERDRTIVTLHYGLGGDEPCNMSAVGAELGLSRERVRQLDARVLERARSLYSSPRTLEALEEAAAAPLEPYVAPIPRPAKPPADRCPQHPRNAAAPWGGCFACGLALSRAASEYQVSGTVPRPGSRAALLLESLDLEALPDSLPVAPLRELAPLIGQPPVPGRCPVHPDHTAISAIGVCDQCRADILRYASRHRAGHRLPRVGSKIVQAFLSLRLEGALQWQAYEDVARLRGALRKVADHA